MLDIHTAAYLWWHYIAKDGLLIKMIAAEGREGRHNRVCWWLPHSHFHVGNETLLEDLSKILAPLASVGNAPLTPVGISLTRRSAMKCKQPLTQFHHHTDICRLQEHVDVHLEHTFRFSVLHHSRLTQICTFSRNRMIFLGSISWWKIHLLSMHYFMTRVIITFNITHHCTKPCHQLY